MVKDITPVQAQAARTRSRLRRAGQLTDVNGTLYFTASERNHVSELGTLYFAASRGPDAPVPNELWRSDGTEAGTILLKAVFPGWLTGVKGIAYFSDGLKLWRSDGTEAGTTVVRVNVPGGKNNNIILPYGLTAVGRTLYFVGFDKRHGRELWRSNGTRAGTTLVRNIHRGSATSDPGNLTAVGGTLFFTAKDGRHGRELWRAGPPPCAKGKCKKG